MHSILDTIIKGAGGISVVEMVHRDVPDLTQVNEIIKTLVQLAVGIITIVQLLKTKKPAGQEPPPPPAPPAAAG